MSARSRGWLPTASREALRQRAALVEQARRFFAARGVLEIDAPLLQCGANLDHGIVPLHVSGSLDGALFLPTSPEHPLKRLVCAGYGAVWSLSPAFRAGERGGRHAEEFRMLEWYRPGMDDAALADEAIALLAELLAVPAQTERLRWCEAFPRFAGIDVDADAAALAAALGASVSACEVDGVLRRELALDLLLTRDVEPQLGRGCFTVLVDYPATACAQARVRRDADGRTVAARFEIYRDGVELANGYHECADAAELRRRFTAELATRGETALVLDEPYLAAIAAGLPDCAGVAVGFDRVAMLALRAAHIADVQAFGVRS